MPISLRGSTDRYVLLLENPARIYREEIDGSLQDVFRNQIHEFLFETTPESALEKKGKLKYPLRQMKHRGSKIRAIGLRCFGEGYDIFFVQALFDKDDENKIYAKKERFRQRALDLQAEYDDVDKGTIEEKTSEWNSNEDLKLFMKT